MSKIIAIGLVNKKWYWDKEYQGTAKLLAETRGDLSEDYAKVKGADEIMKFEINILRLRVAEKDHL